MQDQIYRYPLFGDATSYIGISFQSNPSDKLFFRHWHYDYELFIFLEGQGNFVMEDNKIPLKAGNVILIRPETYHYFENINKKVCNRAILNLSENSIQTLRLAPAMQRLNEAGTLFDISSNPELLQLVFRPIACSEGKTMNDEDFSLYYSGVMIQFLIELSLGDYRPAQKEIAQSAITQQIVAFINENIEKPLSVEIIAKALFLSKSYVANKFLADMHVGLMHFVKAKKFCTQSGSSKRALALLLFI